MGGFFFFCSFVPFVPFLASFPWVKHWRPLMLRIYTCSCTGSCTRSIPFGWVVPFWRGRVLPIHSFGDRVSSSLSLSLYVIYVLPLLHILFCIEVNLFRTVLKGTLSRQQRTHRKSLICCWGLKRIRIEFIWSLHKKNKSILFMLQRVHFSSISKHF